MELIRDVSASWDRQLATGTTAQADLDRLFKGQRERSLLKHDQPLCGVARPHFVSAAELSQQTTVVRAIGDALVKARDHVVANREREAHHLGAYYDWIGDLMSLEHPGVDRGAIVRLDAFKTSSGLHFLELNADSPQGAGHNDGLAAVFQTFDTFRTLASQFDLRPLLLQPFSGRALVDAWHAWGGRGEPRVAMVGWFERYGATAESHERGAEVFLRQGIRSLVAVEPRGLEFDGSRLFANGAPVDLVYRVMLTRDALEAKADLKPLFLALKQNAVCMVNPFRAELMGHKALFALLSDPDVPLGLDASARSIIRKHVPWGRLLRDGPTSDPTGGRTNLLDYVARHRDDLVLKPTHSAQGEGVELGWHHSVSSWEAAVRRAAASDYIVQQRVPTHRESYPAAETGLPTRELYEDTDPFIARGRLGGFLTRLSGEEIVNVARGGSVVPTFVVGHRKS